MRTNYNRPVSSLRPTQLTAAELAEIYEAALNEATVTCQYCRAMAGPGETLIHIRTCRHAPKTHLRPVGGGDAA